MNRINILAHRGIFSCKIDQNSWKALGFALNNGFGIETDLRDHNGKVVISHDPPQETSLPLEFELLLEQIASSPTSGNIALNIKSDGLSSMIDEEIKRSGLPASRFFVFDMSIPDSLSYFKGSVPVYSRISDYERIPAFKDRAKGVWIDNLGGKYPQVENARNLIDEGFGVTIVSPELHGRDHATVWDEIKASEIYLSPLFQICTDLPEKAANQFCKN